MKKKKKKSQTQETKILRQKYKNNIYEGEIKSTCPIR